MESPIKKPVFDAQADKENIALAQQYESDQVAIPIKGIPDFVEAPKKEEPSVASTIKTDEAIEPILQENPQRFVLFPIKYHEVRDAYGQTDSD